MTQVKDTKGNLFTVGHLYEFSDAGETKGWRPHRLHSVDTVRTHQYRVGTAGSLGYTRIREVQGTLGKIEQAPIELIDGEVYSFNLDNLVSYNKLVGYYSKHENAFYVNIYSKSSHIADVENATDIILLKPSV